MPFKIIWLYNLNRILKHAVLPLKNMKKKKDSLVHNFLDEDQMAKSCFTDGTYFVPKRMINQWDIFPKRMIVYMHQVSCCYRPFCFIICVLIVVRY